MPTRSTRASPATAADTGLATVDVCVVDEVIWFEEGEVEALPADLPDAQPTAAEDAALGRDPQGLRRQTSTRPPARRRHRLGAAVRRRGRPRRSPPRRRADQLDGQA